MVGPVYRLCHIHYYADTSLDIILNIFSTFALQAARSFGVWLKSHLISYPAYCEAAAP
jgi:hypothetical protein